MPGIDDDPLSTLIELAADLSVRKLVDRNETPVGAAFTLHRIDREGPLRLTALAAAEGVSQPSMTQLVRRLERQGLVERLGDPGDDRGALLSLTDMGRRLLADRASKRRERLAGLVATLSPHDESTVTLAAQVALPIIRQLVSESTASAVPITQLAHHTRHAPAHLASAIVQSRFANEGVAKIP